jgi:ribosomal-protein-alanine N-acetyltransferase
MFLEVATDNRSAQALYQTFGFEGVGRRDGYYQRANGSRVSAYTMRCDLTSLAAPDHRRPRLWR